MPNEMVGGGVGFASLSRTYARCSTNAGPIPGSRNCRLFLPACFNGRDILW